MSDHHEEAAEALLDNWRYGSAEPTALIQDIAADRRKVERETLAQIDIERLAALEHEQWAHWTKYMLGNLTADNIARWIRQIDTEYGDLSESEKQSDRNWAYRVVRALFPIPTANELPTTPELADVSTPVKLIDRDQSDGYVRVPRDEWADIKTAPKDGTWVLAINAETNPGRQHVVHYSTRHSEQFPWVTDAAPMSWVAGLTHWLSLPAAPNDASDELDDANFKCHHDGGHCGEGGYYDEWPLRANDGAAQEG